MTLCRSSRKPRAVWLRISSGWRYCHEYLSGIRSEIAETSSKGNQEKGHDVGTNSGYKLDQFGYESLAEAVISQLLEQSKIEYDTPFTFLRYRMETLRVHGQERAGCVSFNFLKEGHSIITLNHLLTRCLGMPLRDKLARIPSDKCRIAYLAEDTADYTGLTDFPRYLTLLFEVDALFCNDDRHLNNIAVLQENGVYSYCPIFDNGAGLLPNTQFSRMDIEPAALIVSLKARPFLTTFTRQRNTARSLFGPQLRMPLLTAVEIREVLSPALEFYPARDRGTITDRVTACIMLRQRAR